MKVLHVIPSVSRIRGGPSQAIFEMVKAIRKLGVEASIVTTNDNGVFLLEGVPLNKKILYEGVPTRFFSRFSPNISALREFTFSSGLTKWLWHHVEEYDLLHVHALFSYPSTAAMTIAEKRQVPYFVRPGGHLCRWALQQSRSKKQCYLKMIAARNIKKSSGIHFTTVQEDEEAKSLNISSNSFVLPHGICFSTAVDSARERLRQRLDLPKDEIIILFMSRLHPKKGLEYLISALGRLLNRKFTLVIAGSGDPEYEFSIKSLLTEHRLDKRSYFLGFVEGQEKNVLLHGSDLFALTSHSENFGVVVLEALSAGVPVLVTPGGALSEVVSEQKIGYVPELTVNSIKKALSDFLDNPAAAREKGVRGQKVVEEKYSWDTIAARLVEHYRAACSSVS